MTDSKLSEDIGAQTLNESVGCQHSGLLHVDKKLFGIFKDRSTRYVAISKRLQGKQVCGIYCYASLYSSKAEYAYSTLELQNAQPFATTDKKGFGFLIRFEDAVKPPLRFICVSKEECEVWVDQINKTIDGDKKYSQDSGYASGGSLNGEQNMKSSHNNQPDVKQQLTVLYDIIEDENLDPKNYRSVVEKDEDSTFVKERVTCFNPNTNSGVEETSFKDDGNIYQNLSEHQLEPFYSNECFANLYKGVPECGSDMTTQHCYPVGSRAQDFTRLAQEARTVQKTLKQRSQQKKDLAHKPRNDKNGNVSSFTVPKTYFPSEHEHEPPSLARSNPSERYLSVRKGSGGASTGDFMSVREGEAVRKGSGGASTGDFISVREGEAVRKGSGSASTGDFISVREGEAESMSPNNNLATSASSEEVMYVNSSAQTSMRKNISRSISSSRKENKVERKESHSSPIYENLQRISTATTSSSGSDDSTKVVSGSPQDSSDEDNAKFFKPTEYMCADKTEAKRNVKRQPPGTFAIYRGKSTKMKLLVNDSKSTIYSYEINEEGEKFTLRKGTKCVFSSIEELLDYYLVSSLPKLNEQHTRIVLSKGWNS